MIHVAAAADLASETKSFLENGPPGTFSEKPKGDEAALQLLLLPQNEPLKAYSKEASFLAPSHCRLCFHAFPNRPALSAHTATAAAADKQEVLAHLKTHGLLSMEDRHDDDEDYPGWPSKSSIHHLPHQEGCTVSHDYLHGIR
jgi:hypothetical protein